MGLHGVATGGPEATHQLSDALIEQGFDARLVYFKWDDLREGLPAEFPAYTSFAPEYERYKVNLARSVPDQEGNVIVIPETLAMLAPAFRQAKVLVWWLSVDNAFGALSGLNLNWLRRPNVFHASQSIYAENFTKALGLNSLGMLSDYTIDLTEYATPLPMSERPKIVAFNARPDKVIADLPAIGEAIAELDPEIRCIAIAGMSRPEIAAVFAASRVYVDLGNFPGKDRMPREAASMGCAVIVSGEGGSHEMSFADETEFWDCTRDIVVAVNTYGGSFAAPGNERDTFNTEVRDVFTALQA